MKPNFSAVVGAVLATVSTLALAASPATQKADWGTNPDATKAQANSFIAGTGTSFNDYFKFALTAVSNDVLTVNSSQIPDASGSLIGLTGTFGLYKDAGTGTVGGLDAADTLIGGPLSTIGSTLTYTNLDAGTYFVNVKGLTTGSTGGYYSVTSVLSVMPIAPPPVPEPETYALMLAGLAGLGFMARRRSL